MLPLNWVVGNMFPWQLLFAGPGAKSCFSLTLSLSLACTHSFLSSFFLALPFPLLHLFLRLPPIDPSLRLSLHSPLFFRLHPGFPPPALIPSFCLKKYPSLLFGPTVIHTHKLEFKERSRIVSGKHLQLYEAVCETFLERFTTNASPWWPKTVHMSYDGEL